MHEASWHWVKWLRPSLSGKTFCQLVEACWLAPSPLSPLVLSPLVLSSWGFLGAAWEPLLASRGPPWALLGSQGRPLGPLGRSWGTARLSGSVPGPLLGASWASVGDSWAALGPPLSLSLPILGCPGRLLGLSCASFGGSWGALGHQKRLFTKHHKNHWFSMVFAGLGGLRGASLGPLGGPWGRLGGSWAALGPSSMVLGGSCAFLNVSWVVLGWLLGRP